MKKTDSERLKIALQTCNQIPWLRSRMRAII